MVKRFATNKKGICFGNTTHLRKLELEKKTKKHEIMQNSINANN